MITDKAIEYTANERKFRANFRKDFEGDKILQIPLTCTICDVPMKHRLITFHNLHPFLRVLVCDDCYDYCQITLKTGPNCVPSDNYVFCLWCTVKYYTQEAKVFNFDFIKRRYHARTWGTYFWKCKCLRQFCRECIEKHGPETMPTNTSEWWVCFQCDSYPLWSLRALADVTLAYNKQLRQTKEDETNNCIICFENPIKMAFYPCGHLCLCVTCSSMYKKNHTKCPKCQQQYKEIMRIYSE